MFSFGCGSTLSIKLWRVRHRGTNAGANTYSDRHEMEPVHLAEIVHLILALADVYVHHVNTEYPWQRQGSTMTRVGEDVCGGFKSETIEKRFGIVSPGVIVFAMFFAF